MQREGSVREPDISSSAVVQEMAERELRLLPAVDLLAAAKAAGITLAAEGGQLHIRGPQDAEALGRLLLERKTEVLAMLIASHPHTVEEVIIPAPQGVGDISAAPDTGDWDAERAAAVVAEVNALIDATLLDNQIAENLARRNVLANEKSIVRRLMEDHDAFLWRWPEALRGLLARWSRVESLLPGQSPCPAAGQETDFSTSTSSR